ncbi:MAG: hypothetical protein AAGE01_19475 [Pseudomonadota bacterium]
MIRVLSILLVWSLAAAPLRAEVSGPFLLRSDPWVNLHHFLYHEARNTIRREERLYGRVRTYREDREIELTSDEAATWNAALEIYATYGDRHLLFDDGLRQAGQVIMAGPQSLPTNPEAEPLYAALQQAMPVYEQHWWPRHDAANRARIDELLGYLEQYGSALAERLADGYGVPWPEERIVVDLTNYSGRHGAYATGGPNHIVLASRPDWFPGLLGLDVLFHEAGHTLPFEDQILPRSEAAAKTAGVEEGGAWHAFLFYVPAEAARGVLPAEHIPYAYHDDGPLVDGRMARFEPLIRAALEESDDLDEVFRLIHTAQAGDR